MKVEIDGDGKLPSYGQWTAPTDHLGYRGQLPLVTVSEWSSKDSDKQAVNGGSPPVYRVVAV